MYKAIPCKYCGELFYQNRLQLEHVMKRKLHSAKELMEMELKEVA